MREEEMENKDGVSCKVGFFILRMCADMLVFPQWDFSVNHCPSPTHINKVSVFPG